MIDTHIAPPTKRKALHPALKFTLELGPLALFFLSYARFGIFAATGVMMVTVLITLAVSYTMLRRIPIMPLVTAVIVVIFGSLTLFYHDETLIKIKPTALYLLFAGALFFGIAFNKPMLKVMFDGALHLTDEGWRKLTLLWRCGDLLPVASPRSTRSSGAPTDDRALGHVQVVAPAVHSSDPAVRGGAGFVDDAVRSQERRSQRRDLARKRISSLSNAIPRPFSAR